MATALVVIYFSWDEILVYLSNILYKEPVSTITTSIQSFITVVTFPSMSSPPFDPPDSLIIYFVTKMVSDDFNILLEKL